MAPSAPSVLVVVASAALVAAQTLSFPATPLNQLSFPHPTDAPYQIYPPTGVQYVRGPQSGYNICNSTTQGQTSMCQTMYVNGIDDFCLWGPAQSNSTIADTEGEEVAWCLKSGYGTRIMEQGFLKGVQLLKTDQYWMITGNIDQTLINIQAGDYGGELDSGGQDERGNPIGGLLYSTVWGNGQPTQVQWWTEFIGSNQFCIKICNPQGTNEAGYCQHTLDRIGLAYNCPSKYTIGGGFQDGEFEVCDSDLMTVPGVYVENGVTMSYAQPAESLGPITTMPYSPSLVASTSCTTYASSAIFTNLVVPTNVPSSSGSGAASGSGAQATSGSKSATGSASKSTSASSNSTSDALAMTQLIFPVVAAVAGVAGSIALLA